MTQASSWYIRRLEKGVVKREKKIAKFRAKIEESVAGHGAGKITRAKLEKRKQHFESRIRALSAKVNTYKGAIGKERRKLDERARDEAAAGG